MIKMEEKEKLMEWAEGLRKSGKMVIVEGKKDKSALESLGIGGIITLKKPLYAVVEDVAEKSKEAVILTDFDKKGKELYGRLKKDLLRNGVKVDNHFREFLQRNTRLSHIEGLKSYIERLS